MLEFNWTVKEPPDSIFAAPTHVVNFLAHRETPNRRDHGFSVTVRCRFYHSV